MCSLIILRNMSTVGKNKKDLISQCRRAVADNNLNVLIKLIRTGQS